MPASSPMIHFVGHGHIDPTWLWRWPEGFAEVRATFRSALERLDEYPGIYFTATSASFYAWVRETEPDLFARIQQRVAEGRWEIAGGWWLEPDCNIPCGESLVRQGLYGQRFFHEAFGTTAVVGFNPDSFGHAGTIPQILQGLGLRYYAYQRPEPDSEMAYPGGTTFQWEGPDGSRVLTTNLLESYNGTAEDVLRRIDSFPQSPHLTPNQPHILAFYGVGDHGGGPTKEAIETLLNVQRDQGRAPVHFDTLTGYFRAVESESADLPTIATELQHHARGCYSAHHGIKAAHRRAEHALLCAERWRVWAKRVLGLAYPADELESAWKQLLYNQFHDILAGTSIEKSYADAFGQLGHATSAAEAVQEVALQAMASRIDTDLDGNAVVVFNPALSPRRVAVTGPNVVVPENDQPWHVTDDTGATIAAQQVSGERIGHNAPLFVADLPPLGYRTYVVRRGAAPEAPTTLSVTDTELANHWWRVHVGGATGAIQWIADATNGRRILEGGARLRVADDPSDTWSHGVEAYDSIIGSFEGLRTTVLESGPVRGRVWLESAFGHSRAHLFVTLYNDLPYIDVSLRVWWTEVYRTLKLEFAPAFAIAQVTAEAPYGATPRAPDGKEEPCQRWVDVTGGPGSHGLAVLNDSVYGYDARPSALRFTLLRSPAYAQHDPDPFTEDEPWPIMDQGWHRFRFRLVPHSGSWATRGIPGEAWAFNEPPVVRPEGRHPGPWPRQRAAVANAEGPVLWTCLKQAEDGDDAVLRGYDASGAGGTSRLDLPDWPASVETAAKPHAIQSLRLASGSGQATAVNLLEARPSNG